MIAVDDALVARLGPYLARQRWYAGTGPDAPSVEVVHAEVLATGPPALLWLLVAAGDATYQLLLGARDDAEEHEFLTGSDAAVIGVVPLAQGKGSAIVYDALLDYELGRVLLGHVAPAAPETVHVRPIGVEQSNSSLVFDDRLILKVFRRLHDGPNPDAEVTAALASVGFDAVAAPLALWQRDGRDLAILQPFLAGGSEGWALAQTSLRDLYATGCDDPAECGGDFAGEARRLGEITARMHLALAEAFGAAPGAADQWVDTMRSQLTAVAGSEPWHDQAAEVLGALSSLASAGVQIRAHGDFHLGQVMRTDLGWFVLDFEGEPARPLAERQAPTSPLKDVAGMVRSLHYAAHVALADRSDDERKELEPLADAWEERNRMSYLLGYFSTPGIDALLPAEADRVAALAAWELDKAIYELAYERAYRPDWQAIPRGAIERLLNG